MSPISTKQQSQAQLLEQTTNYSILIDVQVWELIRLGYQYYIGPLPIVLPLSIPTAMAENVCMSLKSVKTLISAK